ncbi:hypothetical protein D3C77_675910 [compost metagenome]
MIALINIFVVQPDSFILAQHAVFFCFLANKRIQLDHLWSELKIRPLHLRHFIHFLYEAY